MANTYDIGDQARCAGAFTTVASGAASDPTAISMIYRKPNGVETTLVYGTDAALVKDSTGNYHADVTIDLSGRWFYRFEGTGAVIAAGETYFDVRISAFT